MRQLSMDAEQDRSAFDVEVIQSGPNVSSIYRLEESRYPALLERDKFALGSQVVLKER